MSDTAIVIESIIKRQGGSKITIGNTLYNFQPDTMGRHVATVTNPEHIARFLQVQEGFRMLGATVAAPAAPVVPASLSATIPAPATSPAPAAPADKGDKANDDPPAPTDKALEDMTDAELRAVFKLEIGRVAPPKSRTETMIAQIEAMRATRAQH